MADILLADAFTGAGALHLIDIHPQLTGQTAHAGRGGSHPVTGPDGCQIHFPAGSARGGSRSHRLGDGFLGHGPRHSLRHRLRHGIFVRRSGKFVRIRGNFVRFRGQGFLLGRGSSGRGLARRIPGHDRLPHLDGIPLADADLRDDAVEGRRDGHHRFVGFHLQQRLVLFHPVAHGHRDGDDRPFGHAIGYFGYLDFLRHHLPL